MKLLQFRQDQQVRLGVKTEKGIIDMQQAAEACGETAPGTMEEIIAGGAEALTRLERLISRTKDYVKEDKVRFAPVVTKPEKIICVGLNYINHAKEFNMPIPTTPLLFNKFNNSLAAHGDSISPPADAVKLDYEAELVIVIGKQARHVHEQDALDYVFGYTVGNDLSSRGLQFRSSQWMLGKTLDQFAPVGPYLVTADEVGDPSSLNIQCKVNGVVRQTANTKDMIFSCAAIISYISQYITLQPGDLIFSGTPDGVILGDPEDQQIWLKPGDEMSVSIERIGTLVNVLRAQG